jgi:hypothetical protein
MGATEGLESLKLRAPEISELFGLLSHPSRLRIVPAVMESSVKQRDFLVTAMLWRRRSPRE